MSGDVPARASDRDERVLVAFFSRAGENYWNGGRRILSVGNTEVLATMIGDRIDCATYRIEAAAPYSERYDPTVQRNVDEQNSDARPAIARPLRDLSPYSMVLIGSPIWNVQPPMIMASFLDEVDLTGVTIRPFVTYAVSGLGSTARFYRDYGVPADRLGDGLAVQGEEVADAATAVDRWLRSASLL